MAYNPPILPGDVILALYGMLEKGQQFYVMPTGKGWCFFYNGQVNKH